MTRSTFTSVLLLTAAHSMAADNSWQAAKEAVANLDWSAAESRYAALAANAPRGSTAWTIATTGQAIATQHAQPASPARIATAARLFEDVVAASSSEPYVARCLMNLGRIAELPDFSGDPIDLDAARGRYETVMRRWPNEPVGSEAALRAAATLIMAFDGPDFVKVRSGIDRLRQWATDHPNNPYAAIMWQYAGETCFRVLGDDRAALTCYDQVVRLGWPDEGNQGSSYWRCARIADLRLHDRAAAIRYYTDLIVNTPTHIKAYAARQRLIELGATLPTAGKFATTRQAEGDTK